MKSTEHALKIDPRDTVAVALDRIPRGEKLVIEDFVLTALDEIPTGHKIAVTDHGVGANVMKYGHSIGHVTEAVQKGQWIHSHNMRTGLSGKVAYAYVPEPVPMAKEVDQSSPRLFDGYVRENGDIGIRNEIWIINTVGCINKTAEQLARMADDQFRGEGIDGVYSFAHPYGCSQLGDDLQYTQKILAGLVRHPNAAGVLILGLGCENNRIDVFQPFLGERQEKRVKFLSVQEVADELAAGMALISDLVAYARTFERTSVPLSALRVGLKCGGSDGFSGMTANPLVGALSDALVEEGGTTLLTEVPEMFGAETILMNRASSAEVFEDIVHLIDDFKDYYTRHGQVIYENPSPGNKEGGITTLEEKSLGCIQKGGRGPVRGVLSYGEPVTARGLHLVQAPGNDMVSVTALIAAGAHLVLFTTGRGTPMGGAVPTVKISSNSALFERKSNWIDFDAGSLVHEGAIADLRDDLHRLIVEVASGRRYARNEVHGFREIAIFRDGVTL